MSGAERQARYRARRKAAKLAAVPSLAPVGAAAAPAELGQADAKLWNWVTGDDDDALALDLGTPAQTGKFLDHVTHHRLSALFELETSTGMRRGEICAARWTDYDQHGKTITVAAQLVQVGWQAVEDEPKSEAGKRVVALDDGTSAALKAHRKRQLKERLVWRDAWQESGKLFTREDGAALHPAAVTELFERQAFAAGLPPIRFHDLRHGAATLALAAGLDIKLVQDRLGHSTSALTRDVYTSVLPDVAHAAAEAAAAMIPRRTAR